MARKDFAAMEAKGPSGDSATRAALRSRMALPTSLRLLEVQPNPRNPRYAEEDPEVLELAATLLRVGQLQPALVISREHYLVAYPGEGRLGQEPWVVIVGNRRLAACHTAGRPTLDVRVSTELTTAEAIEDRVLIENIHRKDLPPLLEAQVLQRRLDQPGATLRSVATAIEKSHMYVQQRLALLKLIPELQQLLRSGALGIRHARELGAKSVDEQRRIHEQIEALPEKDVRAFLVQLAAHGGAAGVVNPVSKPSTTGTGRRRSPTTQPLGGDDDGPGPAPVATQLDVARVSVAQWLDNAVADLDRVLPDTGQAELGQVLGEARRLIDQARALLRPTS